MAQAKTASKNNPTARQKTKEIFYAGEKIKPVKFISEKTSFLSAEYESSGELVVDDNGEPLSWQHASAGN
jgi:hypothetical protein